MANIYLYVLDYTVEHKDILLYIYLYVTLIHRVCLYPPNVLENLKARQLFLFNGAA